MELVYECYDEEERNEAAQLLHDHNIPYTFKDYADEQGCDVFEIWVEKVWLEKADDLLDAETKEQEVEQQKDEMEANPACPQCLKKSTILTTMPVNFGTLSVYKCSGCGYEWPKK